MYTILLSLVLTNAIITTDATIGVRDHMLIICPIGMVPITNESKQNKIKATMRKTENCRVSKCFQSGYINGDCSKFRNAIKIY